MKRILLSVAGFLVAGATFAQVASSGVTQSGPSGWEKKELLDMVMWRPANLGGGDQIAIVQFKTDKLKGSFAEKVKAVRARWQQAIEGTDADSERFTEREMPYSNIAIQETRVGRAGRTYVTHIVAEAPAGDFRAIAFSNNLDDRQPKYGPIWNQYQNEWHRTNDTYHSANAEASGSATATGDRTSTSVKKSVTKTGNGVAVSVTATATASSNGSANTKSSQSGQEVVKGSSTDSSGTHSIPEGIYVARAMRENFNVATGGSEVEPVRDYLWINNDLKVYNGLPEGPDPYVLDWAQMAKKAPKLCGTITMTKAATTITWIGEREPWTIAISSSGTHPILANGLEYHRIRPMDGEKLGGKFVHEPYQMTIGPGGRIDIVQIEFAADGRFLMSGTIGAVVGTGQPQPKGGKYAIKRNSLWLNFQDGSSKGYSIFRDPGGPSNELVISDKLFKQKD